MKHNLNAGKMPKKYKSFKKPSMTVPDQSLSIKEILSRFTSGRPLPSLGTPEYFGDMMVPDLKKMDLTEIAEYQEDLKGYIKQNADTIKAKLKERSSVKPKPEPE
jgi:hypothetical protein